MVDPPSSLRLFLDSLLEGRRVKRSSSWCRWTRSSQVTSSRPLFYLLLIFQRKFPAAPVSWSVRERVHGRVPVHAFGIQYRAFYHAPPVWSLNPLKKDGWKRGILSHSSNKCPFKYHPSGEEKNFMHLMDHLQVKVPAEWREKLYWKPPTNALISHQWRAQGRIMEREIGLRLSV